MTNMENVLELLQKLNIKYDFYTHQALPTIEEAMKYWQNIDAWACKNLFLRNNKGDRHFLVILKHDTAFSLKLLKKKIENQHFTFASPERLNKYLALNPGAVSPFGLINDKDKKVELIVDKQLKSAHALLFHPNDNTATVKISGKDLYLFFDNTGHTSLDFDFSTL